MLTWLKKLFAAPQRRSQLTAPPAWLADAMGVGRTVAGIPVGPTRAMRLAAVFRCVSLISGALAALPLHVYARGTRGRERATWSRVDACLEAPNPLQSGYSMRESLTAHLLLHGNAFALIEGSPKAPKAFWPLLPGTVVPEVAKDRRSVVYAVTDPHTGQTKRYPAASVIHVAGLSLDGVLGLSPIAQAREGLGLALATEAFGARWFSGGSRPSMVLELEDSLGDDEQGQAARERLRESIEAFHQGSANAHGVLILEEKAKATQWTIPPEDAQFLETREFQIAEIARLYGVPAPLLGISGGDSLTYNNGETLAQQLVTYGLLPHARRIESEIRRKCLAGGEYAEHTFDGLLRGESSARAVVYGKALGRWMTRNEIRERENLPRVDGGDEFPSTSPPRSEA